MSIQKTKQVDMMMVTHSVVFYRNVIKFVEDNIELTRKYERGSVSKGSNISNLPKEIQDFCNFVWSDNKVT